MYELLIQKVISAINGGREDLAQFYLSELLLNKDGSLNDIAKSELQNAVPGSKVILGGSGIGFRAGYFEYEKERYYFA